MTQKEDRERPDNLSNALASASWTLGLRQALTFFPRSFYLPLLSHPQWRTEILDYCPSTRVLLIGCKTDLRTDLSTLMELSHQKQAPISYEQVCV